MRSALAALTLVLLTTNCRAQAVEIEELRQDFKACHALTEADKRLDCYDALTRKIEPASFQGARAGETPLFSIEVPTLLRYQSDGPIFVMYLKNAQGDVVQNLHIGGGGEATFLIKRPGTYQLQVSGTDTWRIWLEPQAPVPAKHDG